MLMAIKITVFTTDVNCEELGSTIVNHITIFEKNNIGLTFGNKEILRDFIGLLIDEHVLFEVHGMKLKIIPETNNFQRVRFRFDSYSS